MEITRIKEIIIKYAASEAEAAKAYIKSKEGKGFIKMYGMKPGKDTPRGEGYAVLKKTFITDNKLDRPAKCIWNNKK